MKYATILLALLIFSLLLAACAEGSTGDTEDTGEDAEMSETVQGPALIMFYTDN